MGKILNQIRSVCYEQSMGKYSQEEAYRKIKDILYKSGKLQRTFRYVYEGDKLIVTTDK